MAYGLLQCSSCLPLKGKDTNWSNVEGRPGRCQIFACRSAICRSSPRYLPLSDEFPFGQ